MFTITKLFRFEASHMLTHLPEGHKCRNLHGHSWRVELELSSSHLNDAGFVVDYGDLDPFKTYVESHLDHSHLNDVFDLPTSERLALDLYRVALVMFGTVLRAVRVSETENTWAECRP